MCVDFGPVLAGARVLIYEVLDRGAQAVVRGGARCAPQVLDRCAQPLPAAPLVVRRRYLIVAPGRCPRRRTGS